MFYIIALVSSLFVAQQTHAFQAPDVRSIRCVNKTTQTICVFDASGAQVAIAPRSSRNVAFYTPGNVVWMVSSLPKATMFETSLMTKASKLVFAELAPGHIICEPELNLINWLIMRTKLGAGSLTSGLTFGLVPCSSDEQLHNSDQQFSDGCFRLGAGISTAALTAYIIKRQLFS
jgi:hypothetical protein